MNGLMKILRKRLFLRGENSNLPLILSNYKVNLENTQYMLYDIYNV